MAKKYIDAEAAIESIEQHLLHMIQAVPLKKYEREFYTMAYQHCADVIKTVPAADVAPVVHAHWIRGKLILNRQVCSNCSARFDSLENDIYCPNCGAKMEGVDDGQP